MRTILLCVCFASFMCGAAHADEDTVVSTKKYGAWTVIVMADAMTDKQRFIASVDGVGKNSFLAFKCDPGTAGFYVAISAGEFLGLDGHTEVILRIDKQAPRKETWGGDKLSVYNLDAGYTHQLGKSLGEGKTLKARLETYEHDTLDASFDLNGAAEAIAVAAKGCDDPKRL